MASRWLGAGGDRGRLLVCDVGGFSIKLAEFRRRAGRVALTSSLTVDTAGLDSKPPQGRERETIDRLRRGVSEHGWGGRDVLCLASGPQVATHTFLMPALGAAEMSDALRLRLADAVAFDSAGALVAYRAGPAAPDGRFPVTVVAGEPAYAEHLRRLTDAIGLRMVGLTTTTAVLPALVAALGAEAEGVVSVVVHMGAQSTTLAVVRDGALSYARDLRVGSEALTEAYMRPIIAGDWSLKLQREQAETLKHDVGIPEADARIELERPIEGRHLLPIIQPVLNKMLGEFRQSLAHLTRNGDVPEPEVLFLSGGGAELVNLPSLLQNRLGIPTVPLDFEDLIDMTDASDERPSLALAPAVGLALDPDGAPNLVASQFRVEHVLDRVKAVAKLIVPTAAAVFIALYVVTLSHISEVNGQVADCRSRISRLQAQQKRIDESLRLERELKRCRDAIARRRGRQPDYPGLLKELSLILPADVVLTRVSVVQKDGAYRAYLDGEVQDSQSGFDVVGDSLLSTLKRSPFFRNVALDSYLWSPGDSEARGAEDKRPRFQARCDLVY